MTDNDDWVEEGLEEAYRDGLIEVDQPAADFEDAAFSLSEHGRAYSRDLLRDNPKAVAMVVTLAVDDAPSDEKAEALFNVSEAIGTDAGVNVYRVINEHPDLFPWLTEDAIDSEMVALMEEHINDEQD